VKPKSRHSSLPILVVLFLVSYGLMATLVVEQGRTIENQRGLIQVLFRDSAQLTALKAHDLQKERAEAQARAQSDRSQAKTPSTQATPGDNAKTERNQGKVRRRSPFSPPTDTSDVVDARRALISI
jgi:hypothetical protein